jgi:hypothetical protein
MQCLEQKKAIYLVIGFLEIYFEDYTIQFFPVKLVYCLTQDNNLFKDVVSSHESRLSWAYRKEKCIK